MYILRNNTGVRQKHETKQRETDVLKKKSRPTPYFIINKLKKNGKVKKIRKENIIKYNEYNFHLHPKYIYKNKVSRHSSILHKLVVEVVGHNAVGNVTSRAQNLSASCEYLV